MHRNGASGSVSVDESIHQQLRRATADEHRRVDDGLRYVVGEQLSTDRYIELLAALFGFYVPLEDALASWETTSPPLGLRIIRRSALLRRDLRTFGSLPEQMPTCTEIPTFTTGDQVAGAIYVVEGACLGGQVIARALMPRLGIGPENGAAFFTGHGAHTAGRWKQVLAWLEERDRSSGGRGEIVEGACRTFGALSRWLLARGVLDG